MNEQFLLDTDICSFIIKGNHPELDSRLRELRPEQTLISAVTRAELRFGLRCDQKPPGWQDWWNVFLRPS